MRGRYVASLAVLLGAALGLCAAPPEAPPKLEGKPGKPVLFEVKVAAGKKLGWAPGFDKAKCPVVRLHSDSPDVFSFMALPDEGGSFYLTFWTVGESGFSQTVIAVGGGPAPVPPGPNPPGPTPPDPKPPEPVTSFRAVLIYESGDSLTPAQRGVIFGKAVEEYLSANCTGGKAGWRRRDKDAPGEADPTMAALWAAVRAKLKPTDAPCLAVEVNGGVEIVPLPATPADAVALLKKYREGK